ncbi:hypothetical protein VD0002_g9791 [Verticillium dahliae]|nr:Vitamin H transporter 1 [Verticillium dahliae VDG2]PNH35696.1 hypothetical protein BJF96_g1259 [Verticillium dahliae]PNH48495.1 hypothetical protein VD0004_g122 [Verticillium dahliae]PNH56466.1 hypothetical protein VD0002_g9791 [Verticillium dahliae]PNH57574.1 hypothetical protein VD0003_g225 [Verticillium dahliae]
MDVAELSQRMRRFLHAGSRHSLEASYEPLSDSSIRLLTIKPSAKRTDKIVCELRTVAFDDHVRYRALSYVWGDPDETGVASVNGKSCRFTLNLIEALRQLRESMYDHKTLEALPLWADAVCINQGDNDDKSREVPKMGRIYGSAAEVVIWLGPMAGPDDEDPPEKGDRHNDDVFAELVPYLRSVAHVEAMTADTVAAKPSEHIMKANRRLVKDHLYYHDWFDRTWVIQEAVLAQAQPQVLFGRHVFGMGGLVALWFLLDIEKSAFHWVWEDVYLRWQMYGRVWWARQQRQLRLAAAEAAATADTVESAERIVASELLDLFIAFGSLEASLPADKIYALLALVPYKSLPPHLTPNYDLPFRTVYHDYAQFVLQHTGNINIIAYFPPLGGDAPSWVPDFREQIENDRSGDSKGPGHVDISPDGLELTVRAYDLGECISVMSRPTEGVEYGIRGYPTRCPDLRDVAARVDQEIVTRTAELRSEDVDVILEEWLGLPTSTTDPDLRPMWERARRELLHKSDGVGEEDDELRFWLKLATTAFNSFATSTGLLLYYSYNNWGRLDPPAVGDRVVWVDGSHFAFVLRPVEGGKFRFVCCSEYCSDTLVVNAMKRSGLEGQTPFTLV